MNLSAAKTASILLGATSIFAEDGSSIHISSNNGATNESISNLRGGYREEGRYIINAGSPSRRAITIHGGSCAPGTNVQLFHQLNQDHQKWIYHYDTGAIESVACPGMVLNIEGGSNSNCDDETNIILWYEEGVEWEKWMYSPEGKLISMYCQNSVIDIFNEDDSNGANIQLFRDTGSDSWNQKWSFESSNREPKNSNNRPPKSSNNRPPKRSKNRPAKRSKSSRTSSSSSSKRSKDFDSFNRVAKSSKSSRGSNDFDLSNVGTAAEVAL